MRIDEIHVDGFGLIHARSIEPDPGLTVIRGQNEAGKTTLLSFVRAILFGFETRRYKAMAGGRRGGWLNVSTRDGRSFRIERYGETGGQGRLRILDAAGADLGPGELPILLQGVEQRLFHNIFAFGLDELAQFERLTDSEVAARIYGAGLGLGAVSVLDVEAWLDGQREGLFKPGGHNPRINALLRDLEEVDERLHADLPATYASTVAALAEHDLRLGELDNYLVDLNGEQRRAERARDAWRPWLALREARAARGAMGDIPILPVDLPERLAAAETRCTAADEKVAELERRRTAQEQRLEGISVDAGLLLQQAAVEEVVRGAERDRAHGTELKAVDEDVRLAEQERDQAIGRLGSGWTVERVAAFDDSVAVQSEITGRFRNRLDVAAASLASAVANRQRVSHDLDAAQSELEIVDAAITDLAEPEGSVEVLELERRLSALDSAVAECDGTRQRAESAKTEADRAAAAAELSADQLASALRDARLLRDALVDAQQASALLAAVPDSSAAARGPRRLLPLVLLGAGVALAVLAVLLGAPAAVGIVVAAGTGLAALAVWRLLPVAALEAPGAPIRAGLETRVRAANDKAASAASRLGLAGNLRIEDVDELLERRADDERRLARAGLLAEDADRLRKDHESASERLASAAVAAGVSAAPSQQQVADLHAGLVTARDRRSRRLGLAEQAMKLGKRIERLEHDAAEAQDARIRAQGQNDAALEEWAAWLRGHDLDPAFDRETAKTVVDAVTAAKGPLRLLGTHSERRRALVDEHERFVDRLVEVSDAAGRDGERPADRSAIDRLVADLDRSLKGALSAEQSRRGLQDQIDELRQDEAAAREDAEAARAVLTGLLTGQECEDVDALRSAIAASDAARALNDEQSESLTALTALSGPGAALDRLLGELGATSDVADITTRLDDLETRNHDAERERGLLREEAGALRGSIARMEQDVAATEDRQLREDLLAQLESEAHSWSVYAVAKHVLQQAREAYEAAHRPAVIDAAERYFTEWTAGRYRRILAPLNKAIEEVEHRDGTRVPLANLSTGTAQQLYLAMRFGLVEHFAESAEPLPIVMDDILVNFDDERAALAAASIERLAERHQVIYFTCHPEMPIRSGRQLHLERLSTVALALGSE